jgi:hypothetical protein
MQRSEKIEDSQPVDSLAGHQFNTITLPPSAESTIRASAAAEFEVARFGHILAKIGEGMIEPDGGDIPIVSKDRYCTKLLSEFTIKLQAGHASSDNQTMPPADPSSLLFRAELNGAIEALADRNRALHTSFRKQTRTAAPAVLQLAQQLLLMPANMKVDEIEDFDTVQGDDESVLTSLAKANSEVAHGLPSGWLDGEMLAAPGSDANLIELQTSAISMIVTPRYCDAVGKPADPKLANATFGVKNQDTTPMETTTLEQQSSTVRTRALRDDFHKTAAAKSRVMFGMKIETPLAADAFDHPPSSLSALAQEANAMNITQSNDIGDDCTRKANTIMQEAVPVEDSVRIALQALQKKVSLPTASNVMIQAIRQLPCQSQWILPEAPPKTISGADGYDVLSNTGFRKSLHEVAEKVHASKGDLGELPQMLIVQMEWDPFQGLESGYHPNIPGLKQKSVCPPLTTSALFSGHFPRSRRPKTFAFREAVDHVRSYVEGRFVAEGDDASVHSKLEIVDLGMFGDPVNEANLNQSDPNFDVVPTQPLQQSQRKQQQSWTTKTDRPPSSWQSDRQAALKFVATSSSSLDQFVNLQRLTSAGSTHSVLGSDVASESGSSLSETEVSMFDAAASTLSTNGRLHHDEQLGLTKRPTSKSLPVIIASQGGGFLNADCSQNHKNFDRGKDGISESTAYANSNHELDTRMRSAPPSESAATYLHQPTSGGSDTDVASVEQAQTIICKALTSEALRSAFASTAKFTTLEVECNRLKGLDMLLSVDIGIMLMPKADLIKQDTPRSVYGAFSANTDLSLAFMDVYIVVHDADAPLDQPRGAWSLDDTMALNRLQSVLALLAVSSQRAFKLHLTLSSDAADTVHLVQSIAEHGYARAVEECKGLWTDTSWIEPRRTLHEQLLGFFPSLNMLSAQLLLNHFTLQELAVADLDEMVLKCPAIPIHSLQNLLAVMEASSNWVDPSYQHNATAGSPRGDPGKFYFDNGGGVLDAPGGSTGPRPQRQLGFPPSQISNGSGGGGIQAAHDSRRQRTNCVTSAANSHAIGIGSRSGYGVSDGRYNTLIGNIECTVPTQDKAADGYGEPGRNSYEAKVHATDRDCGDVSSVNSRDNLQGSQDIVLDAQGMDQIQCLSDQKGGRSLSAAASQGLASNAVFTSFTPEHQSGPGLVVGRVASKRKRPKPADTLSFHLPADRSTGQTK